ncbi:MAG: DUF3052 domain-containing protein [Phycisphaerales bacterium]
MAGYSGTPLAKKLGCKPGKALRLVGAPAGFAQTLDPLPEGARATGGLRGSTPLDLILCFCPDRRRLDERLPRCKDRLAVAGALWLAWPKKSSGVVTDISEADIRAAGLAIGLVDVKICAVDETWSGLKFVYRRKDR